MRTLLGMRMVIAFGLALVIGCSLNPVDGSNPDAQAEIPDAEIGACKLGHLNGAWLARYQVLDGDCGPRADEIIMPTGTPYLAAECSVTAETIDEESCSQTVAFTCPDHSAAATFDQVDDTHVTALLEFTYATCAGGYSARLTKIR